MHVCTVTAYSKCSMLAVVATVTITTVSVGEVTVPLSPPRTVTRIRTSPTSFTEAPPGPGTEESVFFSLE